MTLRPFSVLRSCLLLAAASLAQAVKAPKVTIGVRAGTDNDTVVGKIEPRLQWDTGPIDLRGTNLEAGVDAVVRNLHSFPPTRVWTRVQRSFCRRSQPVHASLEGRFDAAAVTVGTSLQANDVRLQGGAVVGIPRSSPTYIQLTKSVPVSHRAVLVLVPRYDFLVSEPTLGVAYLTERTDIALNRNRLTLLHRINDRQRIEPTVDTKGRCSVKYSRFIGDGVLSATYNNNPYSTLQLEWQDPTGLVTTLSAPVHRAHNLRHVKISMKRHVDVPLFDR